jgi:transposase
MLEKKYIAELGNWQGFEVGTVERRQAEGEGTHDEVWIELFPERTRPMRCSGCLQESDRIHDWTERWVRDLPAWGAATLLLVHLRRVKCARCHTAMEEVPWLSPYARVTKRLAASVARLCRAAPVRRVAEHFELSWDQVKGIHKSYLREHLGEPDLSGVTKLGMDEFAIQKGHRYATVIIDPLTREVLWVGRGRGREDIRPFFEKLGKEGRERIEAVVMDMWEPYEQEVRAQCPQVKIVYDFFHVKSKYGREVIDRVRVDEANRLKDDRPAREVVKGSKWLLLRNSENLLRKDRVRLTELLEANKQLATVYVLKDDLAHLWDYAYRGAAQKFWDGWYSRAVHSRIEPLKAFAVKLKERLDGILAHCHYPLNTSVLEGLNNTIKVIKRMAYGFRDDEYFFLRIREAFPGKPG